MITETKDLRPGRYRASATGAVFGFWHEITILPYPPDSMGQVLFTITETDGKLGYGMIAIHRNTPYIHYPRMDPIAIELRSMDTPEASISHVRRVEL